MKKRNRRMFSLTLAVMMLFVTMLPSSAADLTLTPIVQTPSALSAILGGYPELSVAASKPLYSPANEITAYYYTLSPTGYAIVSVQGEVVEWSPTSARNIPSNKTVYYAGPLSYFTKNGASYVDVYSGEACTPAAISNMYKRYSITAGTYDSQKTNYTTRGITPPPGGTEIHYTTYVPNPSIHTNCGCSFSGICGPIAAAILLDYYDSYIDSNILPSSASVLQTGDSLTHVLVAYIQPDELDPDTQGDAATTASEVAGGINAFLSHYHPSGSIGYSAGFQYIVNSYQTYKNFILTSNTPVIVGLTDYRNQGGHWTVGYGTWEYIEGGTSITQYCTIVDGWGDSDIRIAFSYVDYIVYL